MFDHIIGQEPIKKALSGAISRDELGHAYLFTGPDGIGKRTLAEAFARAVLCTSGEERPCGVCKSCVLSAKGIHPDLMHIVPEKGTIKIDTVRKMMHYFADVPRMEHGRLIIIEDSARMTAQAQNAILKSLEEPEPGHIFILTAESAGALLPTIVSRCACFTLMPLNNDQMAAFLRAQGCPPSQRAAIISDSRGLPGRACEILREGDENPLDDSAVAVIFDISQGKRSSLFDFAEQAAAEDDKGMEAMKHLVRFFDEQLAKALTEGSSELGASPQAMIEASKILLELGTRLSANTNARLQWEGALLGIAKCFRAYQ
ncbi:MAG: DNA polymerase III subunit delta' [Eubacteriaceae bacterium]|nr:DNA polymerase III subunit delta' [Eubacteriaceae bacterium]